LGPAGAYLRALTFLEHLGGELGGDKLLCRLRKLVELLQMVVYHYLRGFLISDLPTHLLHHLALARRTSWFSLPLHYLLAVVVVMEVVHYLLVLLDLVYALARFASLCFQLFALGLALGSNFGDDQHLLFSRCVLGNLLLRLLFLLLEVLPLRVTGGLVHFS